MAAYRVSLTNPQSRAEKARRLAAVEQSLLTAGWFTVSTSELGSEHDVSDWHAEAAAFFSLPTSERARYTEEEQDAFGLTYSPPGREPQYEGTTTQLVHSLNMREPLSSSACDALLPASFNDEDRALAHIYHAWPATPELHAPTRPLQAMASRAFAALRERICLPLLELFAALLGLPPTALATRCAMRHSDNASLLRFLEYPQMERSSSPSDFCGVSEHTDFELFSVLHQDSAGLELRHRTGGEWCAPHEPGSFVILVGDMLERLSAGYLLATPHRVRATSSSSPRPRRSLVFFQGLDEEEAVCCLTSSATRRKPIAEHLASLPAAALRRYEAPLTQREWTEAQESEARERLEAKKQAPGPAEQAGGAGDGEPSAHGSPSPSLPLEGPSAASVPLPGGGRDVPRVPGGDVPAAPEMAPGCAPLTIELSQQLGRARGRQEQAYNETSSLYAA